MSKKRTDLEQLNLNAAGIDIGSSFHFVAVPEDRAEKSVRKFLCYTADLKEMVSWLKECKITTVAMESTGVYWMPVFQILEENGFEVILVNARHIKNVPGRKTDVADSKWIQQLHTYGLLKGSYQPERAIRELRTYMRQKDKLIKSRSSHILRMQKSLTQMNVQLHKVISDITGQTGMKIVEAILEGERDSKKLAKMKNKHIRSSEEEIAKALEGNYRDDLLFCLKQELEQYKYISKKIIECEAMINRVLNKMDCSGSEILVEGNKPKDIKKKLEKICGVDLTLIDGLSIDSVETIISEVGTDMTKWPTEKHFGSWLGLSPNNKISGGQILSSKSKKVINRASTAFRMAAFAIGRSNTATGAFYRRLRGRIGAPKAITATAYKIAKQFYKCLKEEVSYNDIGADYYNQKYKDRVVKNLKKRASEFGYKLETVALLE